MLSSLHIRNYILIDSLDIDFPEGLVIITGQTGAGKSILLGALGLLSGVKADASQISSGADSCVVEAEFDGADDSVRAILDENGIEWDDGHLIIRRVVHSTGRSRSFINDCPVQLGVLRDISDRLVDIHSQHRSLLLTDKQFQLSLLDFFAGDGQELEACKASWKRLQSLKSELEEYESRLAALSADKDYNEALYKQLEMAAIRPGELAELEEEQKALANAEQIKEYLGGALSLIEPSEGLSLPASLKEAVRRLEHVSKFLPAASALASRMDSVRIELEDISAEIEDMDASVDLSPDRLTEVEDRMSLLYSLLKKHGCSDEEGLAAVRDSLSEALVDTTLLDDRIGQTRCLIEAEYASYSALASRLSEARSAAAPGFSSDIQESLRFLELERSVFKVSVMPSSEGPSGRDAVSFLFSSTGAAPVDVAKCASGGEISRIMLCLKAMMARFTGMPTLIFDEIDTGVSGSVADRMGQMICDMGRDMQVFSITHLPQVAAKGDAHYVVSKSVTGDGRTVSSVRRVSGEDRVNEIARLLSGAVISQAAVQNARSLLDGR